jgi:predicted esterase
MRTVCNVCRTILIPVFFILIFMSGCGQEKSGKLSDPWPVTDGQGVSRHYNLYLPAVKKPDMPLLVYFHGVMSEEFKDKPVLKGYTGSPVSETGLVPFCNAKGIILLEMLPSYSYRFLDVEAHGWSPLYREIDGVEKCIDKVVMEQGIRAGNVILAGISAGAVISHHLANRRPDHYEAVLSHSQAYIDEKNNLLTPDPGKGKFGVVFCYTKGDYNNLKELCLRSYEIYRRKGFNTVLLKDLHQGGHQWSSLTNGRLWRSVLNVSENNPGSNRHPAQN